MGAVASPWDALLRLRTPVRTEAAVPELEPEARAGTRLSCVLAAIGRAGDVPTLSLAVECDLTSNQVWGLLKAPRARGQVHFDNGRWSLSEGFLGRDVQRAVDLLRSKGWRVQPPEST